MGGLDTLVYVLAALAAVLGLGILVATLWPTGGASRLRPGTGVIRGHVAGPARHAARGRESVDGDRWRRARAGAEAALDRMLDHARGLGDEASRGASGLARELRELADEVAREQVRDRLGRTPGAPDAGALRALAEGLERLASRLLEAPGNPDPAAFVAACERGRAALRRLRLGFHLGPEALAAADALAPDATWPAAGREIARAATDSGSTAAPDSPPAPPSPAVGSAWVARVLAHLGRLHREVVHVLKNKLAAASRYQDDPERFRERFHKPAAQAALKERLDGERGLLARLDALTPLLLSSPELPASSPLADLVGQVLGLRTVGVELREELDAPSGEKAPGDLLERVLGHHGQVQRFAELYVDASDAHGLDLREVVRELVEEEREAGAEPAVELAEDAAPLRVHVLDPGAGRGRVREALCNLLQNAAQAGADRVRLTLFAKADEARLVVEDDGAGMPVEDRARAERERFSTRGKGGGTGLEQARRLAEELGGGLQLDESRLGGLAVRFELPRV